MSNLWLRFGFMAMVWLFFSCAGINYKEFSRLYPQLDLKVQVAACNQVPLDADWIGCTDHDLILLVSGKKKIALPENSLHYIRFRDVFLPVPAGKRINFYAYHPDSVSIPPYQMIFYPADSVAFFQLIRLDSAVAQLQVPDTRIGFLPVYVYRRDILKLFSLPETRWLGLTASFYHAKPLEYSKQAIQDTNWKWQFKKFLYPSVWVCKPQIGINKNYSTQSSSSAVLNQGMEVYLVDSLEDSYRIINLEDGFHTGWVKKDDVSHKMVSSLSQAQIEQWQKKSDRQDWIRKNKISREMGEAILAGKVVEGMSQAMVIASWGNPKQKIKKGPHYFYPIVWIYESDAKVITMNFDRDGILQTLHSEKK